MTPFSVKLSLILHFANDGPSRIESGHVLLDAMIITGWAQNNFFQEADEVN